MTKITPLTVAQFLSDLARELREKRPIELVLVDLEEALKDWRDVWPDDTEDYDDEEEEYNDDEDEIL